MDDTRARRLLGVQADAGPVELRQAYREQLFALHPDRHDIGADAVRSVIDAYRFLSRSDAAPPLGSGVECVTASEVGTEESPAVPEDGIWLIGPDTIALAMPTDDAYLRLLEVAHRIGDVTYVDRSCALMEVLLRTRDGTTMSLVISLQGRATGHTEAFVTLEPLDLVRGPLPNVADLTDLVVSQLR